MRAYVTIIGLSSLVLLSGCASHFDMQGHDPREYYAANPIENKVVLKTGAYVLPVSPSGGAVHADDAKQFAAAYEDVSVAAVESVTVRMNPKSYAQKSHRTKIKTMLQNWGYHKPVRYEPLDELPRSQVVIEVSYNTVIAPECPDWRLSPVTTYSNHVAPNYGCASTVNLGLMVADPKDLVSGSGSKQSNTERASKALSDYRAGAESSAASPASSTGASQ